MNNFLWCFTPAGISLATHLKNGAVLELDQDCITNQNAYLYFEHKGLTLKCELDHNHGWLPKRISTPGKEFVWEVQEFRRVAGIWFPQKGIHTIRDPQRGTIRSTCFQVTSLRVNELASNANFGLPENSRGAVIKNLIQNTTQINGGPAERKKLLAKHAAPEPVRPMSQGLIVPTEPSQSAWHWVLTGVGVTAIIGACVLQLRRRK